MEELLGMVTLGMTNVPSTGVTLQQYHPDRYRGKMVQGSSENHPCKDVGWIQAVLEFSPPGDVGAAPTQPMDHDPKWGLTIPTHPWLQ